MSDFLNDILYPALFERLPETFPEFHFREKAKGGGYRLFESRTGCRPDGHTGGEVGKTYVSEQRPFYLGDLNPMRGRSIWAYVKDRERLDNAGTFARLCELANVRPEANLSPAALERMERAQRRAEVFEAVNSFYLDQLHTDKTAGADKARRYLSGRGYTLPELRQKEQEIKNEYTGGERMELGFCPNLQEVEAHLRTQKEKPKSEGGEDANEEARFTLEEIKTVLPPFGAAGRVSITLRERGRIIGFKFRAIDETEPKYLNLEGYKKENHLPGLTRAENVVLVEGELDAMRAHAAGFKEVAALGGSFISDKQIEAALRAGARSITLALDNDAAGKTATRAAVEALLRYQEKTEKTFAVFVCHYPEGCKDFDELLNLQEGKEKAAAMLQTREAAPNYLARFFENERAPQIAAEHTGGRFDRDMLRPYFKEELTQLWRLLPASETGYFEHLLNDILEAYFLKWDEIKFEAENLREIEAGKRYRQEAAKKAEEAAGLFKEGKSEEAEEALKEVERARSRAGAGKFTGLLQVRTEAALREHILNAPLTLETSFKIDVDGRKTALKLPAGGISIFAARPGHGKSRMLVNLALDICGKHAGEVHYFTYEESAEKVTLKALNAHLDRDFAGPLIDTNEEALEAYFKGRPLDSTVDATKFETDKEAFFGLAREQRFNIHFSEMPAESLVDAIRYLHRRRNISAVFVDYIQLLNLEKIGRGINNRQEEVKQICNLLKDAARETGLPIILAAQFSREVKKEEDVNMGALREAGDIEQTAALILGMWNRYQDLENPAAEIVGKVLKNRGGSPNGRGEWAYNGDRYKVYPEKQTTQNAQTKNENPFQY